MHYFGFIQVSHTFIPFSFRRVHFSLKFAVVIRPLNIDKGMLL